MDQALQEWARAHDYFPDQLVFVRDRLTPLVGVGWYYLDAQKIPRVISEHGSKGHTLPVYSLARPDLGVRFVLRDNFYNWKLSVISERPIESEALRHLFETEPPREPEYTGDDLRPVYFEGFPPDLIFGYYAADNRRFSAQLALDFEVWAVIFEVMRVLGAMPVRRAMTRAEHRVELDRDRKRWNEEQARRLLNGEAV